MTASVTPFVAPGRAGRAEATAAKAAVAMVAMAAKERIINIASLESGRRSEDLLKE